MLYNVQVFFVGMCYNLQFIIQEKRTKPEHLAVALELNQACGVMCTFICPMVASAPNIVKSLVVTFVSLVAIISSHLVG